MSDSHVPIARVNALLAAVQARGVKAEELLQVVSLSPEQLQTLERLPLKTFSLLYQRSMWLLQDESFGMVRGGQLPLGAFRMLCLVLIQAQDLRHALHDAEHFYQICRGVWQKPVLLETPSQCAVKLQTLPDARGPESAEHALEIQPGLSIWHRFMCWLVAQDIVLSQVHVSPPVSAERCQTLTRLYRAPVCPAEEDALYFSAHYLDLPVVQNRDTLRQFLKTAPYQLLTSDLEDDSLSARVAAILGKDFTRALPTAETVAQQLGLSLSSLRRRLQQEGQSFQGIKDQCRQQAATTYLQSPALSISEVANLLGFEEVSAFHRCFKRWTGQTPGQYRSQL